MTEKDLFYYIKMKAQKGVEVNTSIIRKIDEYIKSQEPVEDEEPIEEPNPDPIEDEEPETPIEDEEPEPQPENPKDPLSNFEAIILDNHNIQCRWDALTDGEIDIEFSVPIRDKDKKGKDIPWKHSVLEYTKEMVPILKQSYVIWVYDTNERVLFRAKKPKWTIFGIDFFTWYSPVVEAKKAEPKPEPVKPKPVIEPDPIEEPIPEPDQPVEDYVVEMALVFLAGKSFDTWVNGEKVKDEFDYTFGNNGVDAGVKLVNLNEQFKTLVIDKSGTEQNIKVVNRDPDNNLREINSNHVWPGTPDTLFWGTPAQQNHPLGVIYSRHGDTRQKEGEHIPDPEFWKGMRDDPINRPNERIFHTQWSDTGKIVISFLS